MNQEIQNLGFVESFPFNNQWNSVVHGQQGWFLLKGGINGEPVKLSKSEADDISNIITRYKENRISFFLPHGQGKDFINDWTNGICMLTAGTRQGKSACGIAWLLFRTLRCDPKWHCFLKHGIDYHEFRGPRQQVISSYSWGNVEEIYQEILKWTPRKLLGPYALDWGKYDGETAKQKCMTFNGRSTRMRLTDGNEFVFLCDNQGQNAWEGKRWDDGFFDEQRQREKFIGFLRGQGNTMGLVQSCFCLTGHVLPDRPDTGASGWIKTELWDGEYTFGKTIGRYKIGIEDVPDEVMSKERKDELYEQWVVGPEKTQNEDDKRKAIARYYGGWEPGGGLVISEFEPAINVIPESVLQSKHDIFKDATKFRAIDHGLGRPGTCVWGMIFPWNQLLIYREYYRADGNVPDHAKNISELSGSQMVKSNDFIDPLSGLKFETRTEVFGDEEYYFSILDCRSFASPAQESQRTLGNLYQDYGLQCSPARGWRNEKAVPHMKLWFKKEPTREHLMHHFWKRGIISRQMYAEWLESVHGEYMNAPKIYFVSGLRWTFSEFRSWAMNPETGLPISKNDHIVGGALKYMLIQEPRYVGHKWDDQYQIVNDSKLTLEPTSKHKHTLNPKFVSS